MSNMRMKNEDAESFSECTLKKNVSGQFPPWTIPPPSRQVRVRIVDRRAIIQGGIVTEPLGTG